MTSRPEFLLVLCARTLSFPLIILTNGDQFVVTDIGSCDFGDGFVLWYVLLVLDFQYNLISVSTLTIDLSCCDIFFLRRISFYILGPLMWEGHGEW